MTLSLNITGDLDYVDGTESLTLRVDGQADQVVAIALNEPATWKEAEASNGVVQQGDQMWVWNKHHTPVQPPLGSKLVDSKGNVWTILTIVYKDLIDCWEVAARNLAVANRLDCFISILRAEYIKSSAGEAIPVWATYLAGVRARVQPTGGGADLAQDADWSREESRVICESLPSVPLACGDYRVVDADGLHYRIASYQQAERIDELPVLTVTRIYEGAEGQLGAA